jgi:rubrerythrin
MRRGIDFASMSLRGAFDFAILIEEDAQLRYQEFAESVADPEAAAFFREMVVNEGKHRLELEARRRALFRHEPERIEISVLDGGEAPDRSEVPHSIGARQAMEVALRAEERAWEFYDRAIPHLQDEEVRHFFEELREEEVLHQQMLQARLDALPGPGRRARS